VFGKPLMPYFLFYAPPVWGPELAGKLLLGGVPDASFGVDDPGHNVLSYYVIGGDKIEVDPVARPDNGWAVAAVAAPAIRPFRRAHVPVRLRRDELHARVEGQARPAAVRLQDPSGGPRWRRARVRRGTPGRLERAAVRPGSHVHLLPAAQLFHRRVPRAG